jgi:hypothetical protein
MFEIVVAIIAIAYLIPDQDNSSSPKLTSIAAERSLVRPLSAVTLARGTC